MYLGHSNDLPTITDDLQTMLSHHIVKDKSKQSLEWSATSAGHTKLYHHIETILGAYQTIEHVKYELEMAEEWSRPGCTQNAKTRPAIYLDSTERHDLPYQVTAWAQDFQDMSHTHIYLFSCRTSIAVLLNIHMYLLDYLFYSLPFEGGVLELANSRW